MTSHHLSTNSNQNCDADSGINEGDQGLRKFADRLAKNLERDALVQKTTDELRDFLQVDRVVLYYFYRRWRGQVIFESLSSNLFSIFGSTGTDDCFNDEYAEMYLKGRVRAITNVELELITPCHKDFLTSIQVQANLVVPVLISNQLWGLLIAHHCQTSRIWLPSDIEIMQKAAEILANAPAICQA